MRDASRIGRVALVTAGVSLALASSPARVAPAADAGPPAPAAATSPKAVVRPVAPWLSDFREVWELAAGSFVDRTMNGLDWGEVRRRYEPLVAGARDWKEARSLINAMLAELGASHTAYYRPDEFSYWFLAALSFRNAKAAPEGVPSAARRFGGKFECPTIGVLTITIDGEIFVSGVIEGGPAADAGVLTGDRIVSVDGGPWEPVAAFRGKENRPVVLRVQRSLDPPEFRDLRVTPKRLDPVDLLLRGTHLSARVIQAGGCRIACVRPWYFAPQEPAAVQLRLLREDIRDADALILDLREGYGGVVENFLDLFARGPMLTFKTREGPPPVASNVRWKKPAACLVNGHTRSGKELLADAFRRYGYGPVVGERTQGAVLGGQAFPVGQEGLLFLAITEVLSDGVRLEGVGVEPDIAVPFDIRYAAGRDPQLDRALSSLTATLGCAVTP